MKWTKLQIGLALIVSAIPAGLLAVGVIAHVFVQGKTPISPDLPLYTVWTFTNTHREILVWSLLYEFTALITGVILAARGAQQQGLLAKMLMMEFKSPKQPAAATPARSYKDELLN